MLINGSAPEDYFGDGWSHGAGRGDGSSPQDVSGHGSNEYGCGKGDGQQGHNDGNGSGLREFADAEELCILFNPRGDDLRACVIYAIVMERTP